MVRRIQARNSVIGVTWVSSLITTSGSPLAVKEQSGPRAFRIHVRSCSQGSALINLAGCPAVSSF